MAAGLGLSNGPRIGVGTRETGDSAPRSTTLHRLDWFFTCRSLRRVLSTPSRLTVLSSLSSFRRCFRFLLAVQSRVLQIRSLSLAALVLFFLTILRPLLLRRASSCSRNETEEKEETAGEFPTGRAKGDASEIKHLFKWQPFLSATSTHTAARYVYWHLIHVRCVCARAHARVRPRGKARGVNRAGGRFRARVHVYVAWEHV